MKKFLVCVLTAVLALSLGAGVAIAAKGGSSATKRAYQFHGTLSNVDGDADPLTEGPFMITVTKANGNGKRYLRDNPGDVTVTLSPSTRYYGFADDASDFAVGDAVKVKAKHNGTGFDAKKVKHKGS